VTIVGVASEVIDEISPVADVDSVVASLVVVVEGSGDSVEVVSEVEVGVGVVIVSVAVSVVLLWVGVDEEVSSMAQKSP
jgi:Na+(H+)/acetate symporter ActP